MAIEERLAQERDDHEAKLRALAEESRLLEQPAAQMTDEEYEGRVPLRPHLAVAFAALERRHSDQRRELAELTWGMMADPGAAHGRAAQPGV